MTKLVEPRVFIIILNWNGWQDTLSCLSSLDNLDYSNYRVVVVDNGSEDGSQERIEAMRSDLTLLQTGANLGYAGGNNVGIRYALSRGADFVWVLNNDVLVEPDALSVLVRIANRHPNTGIVGSHISDSLPDKQKVKMPAKPTWRWDGLRIEGFICEEACDTCQTEGHFVDGVSGSSILLRSNMLYQLGAFDERFFHYFDDGELCERARQAGWQTRYACRARVWHEIGASMPYTSPQARYYYIRNWLLFLRWSHGSRLLPLILRDPVTTIGRIMGIRWLALFKWRVAGAGMLGALDASLNRYGRRDLPLLFSQRNG